MATAKLDVLLSFKNKLGGINQSVAGLANVAKGIAGIAAAYVSFRAVTGGMKGIINLGSQLSDLSTQTGLSIRGLMTLQQAFADSGVGADKVAASINKMQRALIDANDNRSGEQNSALREMGLDVETLLQMSPQDQFKAIAGGIGKIGNQAQRTAVAMKIFGKSGAELLNVFESGVIEDATKSLGLLPAVMERNVKQLDRVGDLLERIPNKTRQVFAGIADELGDMIQEPLERLDKMDFVNLGRNIGAYIKLWKDAITNGNIGELLEISLGAGFEQAVAGFKALMNSTFSADGLGIAIGISTAIVKGCVNALADFVSLLSAVFGWVGRAMGEALVVGAATGIAYLITAAKYAFRKIADASSMVGVMIAESDAARSGDYQAIKRAADFRARVEAELAAQNKASWDATLEAEKRALGVADGMLLPSFTEIYNQQQEYFDAGKQGFSELLDNLTAETRATLGLADATGLLGDGTKSYTDRLRELIEAQKTATDERKGGPLSVEAPATGGTTAPQPPAERKRSIGEGFRDALSDYSAKIGSLGDQFYEMTTSVAQSIQQGIGGSIEGLINRTMTWGDALRNIGSTILSSVITSIAQMGAKWITTQLVMFALGQKLKAADSATTAAKGAADAAAMAPAAAMASISSFGAAALVGIAALVAGMAIAGAFADGTNGRLTGPGTSRSDSMLAAVSPGEAILNDRASAWLGDSKIRELNQTGKIAGGRTPPTVVTGAAPQVNIAMLDGKRQVQGFLESTRGKRYLYNMATRQMRTA